MYKEDLAFNKLQWLICHKTQTKRTLINKKNRKVEIMQR